MEDFKERIDSLKLIATGDFVGPSGKLSLDRCNIISQELNVLAEIFEHIQGKLVDTRKEMQRLKERAERAEKALRKAELRAIRHQFIDLFNYNGFAMEYKRLMREFSRGMYETAAIAYFDLDGFKKINDLLGHDVANDILIELGVCLADTIRPVDTAACLHGDEFALIFPGADLAGAERVMERIKEKSLSVGMNRPDYAEILRKLDKKHIISFTPGYFIIKKGDMLIDVKDALHSAESVIPKFAKKREREAGLFLPVGRMIKSVFDFET